MSKKLFNYLITTSSEYEGNRDILDHWVTIGEPFFQKKKGEPFYSLELIAVEEIENQVIEMALAIKIRYKLKEIQVWKKGAVSQSLYAVGLSFNEIQTELLLGYWSDWRFLSGKKDLVDKDRRIKEMEQKLASKPML